MHAPFRLPARVGAKSPYSARLCKTDEILTCVVFRLSSKCSCPFGTIGVRVWEAGAMRWVSAGHPKRKRKTKGRR